MRDTGKGDEKGGEKPKGGSGAVRVVRNLSTYRDTKNRKWSTNGERTQRNGTPTVKRTVNANKLVRCIQSVSQSANWSARPALLTPLISPSLRLARPQKGRQRRRWRTPSPSSWQPAFVLGTRRLRAGDERGGGGGAEKKG